MGRRVEVIPGEGFCPPLFFVWEEDIVTVRELITKLAEMDLNALVVEESSPGEYVELEASTIQAVHIRYLRTDTHKVLYRYSVSNRPDSMRAVLM